MKRFRVGARLVGHAGAHRLSACDSFTGEGVGASLVIDAKPWTAGAVAAAAAPPTTIAGRERVNGRRRGARRTRVIWLSRWFIAARQRPLSINRGTFNQLACRWRSCLLRCNVKQLQTICKLL